MSNIVGLDLNIDPDYLERAVHETVTMGIAEALNGKNEIVSQIVHSVLTTKVDKDGRISSYPRDNVYSLLDHYVKKLLEGVIRDELTALVNERKSEITAIIRSELAKKVTVDGFANRFIDSVQNAISQTYTTKIDVCFDRRTD